MAAASNPLRTEAEEFVRAELRRLGVAGLDKAAIVKRFVGKGASKTRVHEWIKAVVAEEGAEPAPPPAPDPGEARSAAAAVAAAAVLDSLPPPAVVAAVTAAAKEAGDLIAAAPPGVSIVPDKAAAVLDQLELIIGVAQKVIKGSHGEDGRVRNPRMALLATETLRKILETALKLYESINNVRQVEAFMAEMLAAVRELSPETARAVVERMQAVQGRWAG